MKGGTTMLIKLMKGGRPTGDVVVTSCTGCQCHEMDMQFGELVDGCCRECGCPKTSEAALRLLAKQKASKRAE